MKECIDWSGVFPAHESMDECEQVIRLVEEQTKRTDPIRKRVLQLEAEDRQLYKDWCIARASRKRLRMSAIEKKMAINRDLRNVLYRKWRANL